jgi:hypothetical protein
LAHTGIRLRVTGTGGLVLLEGDSDWLYMAAQMAMYDAGELLPLAAGETKWHQIGHIVGGEIQLWIQPVMLPDSYPDDDAEDFPDPEPFWDR